VCGLLGVAVMIGTSAVAQLGLDVFAQLAVIGAAVSYAFAGIFGRRFKAIPPLTTAAGQLGASAIIMLPLVMMVDTPWRLPVPAAQTWAAVLGLALLSTALAYIIYFRILARAGATNILLVTLLVPVSAVLLATMVLGEALQARQVAGMGLIALGLAAIDGRPMAACRAAIGQRRRA
jgi:drug/metabolite transporter (DMT)-like permease